MSLWKLVSDIENNVCTSDEETITILNFSYKNNWSVKLKSHLFDAITKMIKRHTDNEKDTLYLKSFITFLDIFFRLRFLLQYMLWHFLSSWSVDISIKRSVLNSISLDWNHQSLFIWQKVSKSFKVNDYHFTGIIPFRVV